MLASHPDALPAGTAASARREVFPAWVHAARIAHARWRSRRRAIADLHALSDRALADIGIERSEIDAVVHAAGRDARSAASLQPAA